MGHNSQNLKLGVSRELFDLLLIACALLLFLNVVVALIFLDSNQEVYLGIRKEGFRMAACWVLLLAIVLASSYMREQRFLLLVMCALLGWGIQEIGFWRAQAQGAQLSRFELVTSVASVYFALPCFIVLLVSTKVDNLWSTLEKERLRHQKLSSEASKLVDLLRKSKEVKADQEVGDDEATLGRRRATFEMAQEMYLELVNLKTRRDANAFLERLFAGKLAFAQGFVLETPDEGRELKVRNVWGFLAPQEKVDRLLADFKDRELSMWVLDRKEWLDSERIRKQPNLFEAADRFNSQLFGLERVIPVVSQGRTVNVIYLGEQSPQAPVPFDHALLEPLLAGLGLVLAKLTGKKGARQFATFG